MVSVLCFDICNCRLHIHVNHQAACFSGHCWRNPCGRRMLGTYIETFTKLAIYLYGTVFRFLQIFPTIFFRIYLILYFSKNCCNSFNSKDTFAIAVLPAAMTKANG